MQWENGFNGSRFRKTRTIDFRKERELLQLCNLELEHENGANRVLYVVLEVQDVVVREGRLALAMDSVLAPHGRTELLLSDLG